MTHPNLLQQRLKRRTLILGAAASLVATQIPLHAAAATRYDDTVLSHNPKHYYPRISGDRWIDAIRGLHGTFMNGPSLVTGPDGSTMPHFNGFTQWARLPDSPYFSPGQRKTDGTYAYSAWTMTCWFRPTVLDNVNYRGSGGDDRYVHWANKRRDGGKEWLLRMYNLHSRRPNRVSGYVLDNDNHFGAGQYYQDGLVAKRWYHIAFVIRLKTRTVGLFVNGVQSHGWASFTELTGNEQYDIHPQAGSAPVIIGRDAALDSAGRPRSWFRGGVGKPAFFTYDLSVLGVSAQYPAGRITRQALAGQS